MLGSQSLSKWAAKQSWNRGSQYRSLVSSTLPSSFPLLNRRIPGLTCSQGSEDRWKAGLVIQWLPRSGKDTRLGGASFSQVDVDLTSGGPWLNKWSCSGQGRPVHVGPSFPISSTRDSFSWCQCFRGTEAAFRFQHHHLCSSYETLGQLLSLCGTSVLKGEQ